MKMDALRALRHRNFRLFFCGQSLSLIGTWMTRLATSWLVYRLTGSSLLLGVITFASQIPTFLLGPVAGVWADRWDRRRVLLITQLLALAGLTLSGRVTISEIVGLSILQGLINAFDMPARQSFLVQMVDGRADLSNAIALNSTMVNSARLLGPALAGITIAAVGGRVLFPDRRAELFCGDRFAAGDEDRGPGGPKIGRERVGSTERRLDLCGHVRADPNGLVVVRDRQFHGRAVHGSDAGVRH